MNLPKLIITDIDGVWTDGGMYYDNESNEFKKFNTTDSEGVIFCNILDIPVAIITGEKTEIVKRRAEKLKIKLLYQAIENKLKVAYDLVKRLNISLSETAFIGDDINDLKLLNLVGFSAVPNNAPDYIKNKVDFVTKKNGGEGAFREFIEKILIENDKLESVLELYLNK